MNYRPVVGWGRLPEGWSYVEATSVAVDANDNVIVFTGCWPRFNTITLSLASTAT